MGKEQEYLVTCTDSHLNDKGTSSSAKLGRGGLLFMAEVEPPTDPVG